ncbi:U3 small nucleolar ribonucleoprotein mpp10 [Tolypocladium ophioglossoides CBS 100239]|uniref:U3 small nucleolar ribonucleoprotein protein MPP10 n=1 Tax=Tolypocladium ophioglossoides (strain CBS 100239) TaxID=1163406 RepID=A0A0L0N470_TOLOC|nr:U3 small nucleolar ribonucleoprotein mpp10 [Tolypocladium ophioglossoides CBS 100239]
MAPAHSTTNGDMLALLESLRPANRHAFLQPSAAIPNESLNFVKDTLEGFAAAVGEQQEQRLKESRKRKRGGDNKGDVDVLKLRKVYVDGFETGQVCQQAKKIIGGVLKFSEAALDELEERNEVVVNGVDEEAEPKSLTFGEDGFEVGSDEDEEEDGKSDLLDDEAEGPSSDNQEDEEELEGELEVDEEEVDVDGQDDYDDEDDDEEEKQYVEDPNGLNDGFFSIDDFNKQTQWFEDQDARGNPTTDHASDDEDVDWAADPFAPLKGDSKSAKRKTEDDEQLSEDDDDEDDGPTFGDMALDAPEGESEDEAMDDDAEDDGEENNANEVYYKDFFAPPPRKGKGDKPKKSVKFDTKQPAEGDVERAMADVRRDLFEDESENEDSDDALSDVSAGDPKSRRSAHQRRQAKLADEIRKLEAASVAKREWTLSGEAKAVDRPMNSLLEEDLDFEHVGKPVPVITPEISESIEELIKRRILAQEFDEVIKRRPDAESVPTGTRRGMIELDDSKPSKSLAEVYEEEHVKNANPDGYVSKSDEKLQREEKEVEGMWRDVCARLDALSSWHYKPKPTAPSLSVVADVATVAMEDAQPATAQGVAGESSRMAPQEVYKAGADKATVGKGEVVTRGGVPLARQEMSREDRTRRRRSHKERVRKAGGVDGAAGAQGKTESSRARMQRETMAELKKGGVKVINRKGEITDVAGNKAKAAKVASSGSYKL